MLQCSPRHCLSVRIVTRSVSALVLLAAVAGSRETALPASAETPPSPVAYSAESVREGRKTYLRLCQYCHGQDGRAQANPDFDAPSLRRPQEWRNGVSDERLFLSIKDGVGHDMPPFRTQLKDEQIWRIVHFLRSIGPEKYRGPGGGRPE